MSYTIEGVYDLESPSEPMYGVLFSDGVVVNVREVGGSSSPYEITVMRSSVKKFDTVSISNLSGFSRDKCQFAGSPSQNIDERLKAIERAT